MAVTRYEELNIQKDQLEAQLREISRNMDVVDDPESRGYLLEQLNNVQVEIDRVKLLIKQELEE